MNFLNLDVVYVILSLLGIFCTAAGVVDLYIRKEHGWSIFPARTMSWTYILSGVVVSVSGVFRLIQIGVQ